MRPYFKRAGFAALLLSALTVSASEATTLHYRVPLVPGNSVKTTGDLRASLTSVVFDDQQINYGRASQKITLTNVGSHKVAIADVRIDDSNFEVSSGCAQRLLMPAGSCLVDISFRPGGAPGMKVGNLQISQDGSGDKVVQLSGKAVSAQVLVPGSLVFDSTPVGGSSTKQLAVRNTGIGPVALSIPSALSGDNFKIVETNCANQLEAQESCAVLLKFVPSTAGVVTQGLARVGSGAGNFDVSLTGQGLLGILSSASGAGLAFPDTLMNTSSAVKSLTISNSGTYAVSGLTIPSATGFVVSGGTCGSTLAVAESCTLTVSFAPGSVKAYADSLKFSGSRGETLAIPVSGNGVNVGLLTANSGAGLAFPDTLVDTSSTARSVTITNSGGYPVSQLNIPTVPGFVVSAGTCGSTLAVAESCTFTVVFAPNSAKTYTDSLKLSGSLGETLTIPLSGKSVNTGMLSSSSSTGLAFPDTLVNTSSVAKSVTISNTGGYAVAGLAIPTAAGFGVSTGTCGSTLAVAESCTFTVTFSPNSAKAYADSLKLFGSRGETLTIPLSGKGVSASVQAETPLTATYQVGRGSASGSTVKVLNSGGVPVTISGFTVSNKVGNFSASYGEGCNAGKVLQPGEVCGIWTSGDGSPGTSHSGTVTVATSAGTLTFNRTFQVVDVSLNAVSYYPGINGGGVAVVITVSNAASVPFQVVPYNRGAVFGPTPAEWGYFSGGFSSNFTWGTSDCGAYLANGSKCTINILPNNPMYSWTYYTNYQLMGAYPKTDSGVVVGTVPQDNTAVWVGGPFQITYMAY